MRYNRNGIGAIEPSGPRAAGSSVIPLLSICTLRDTMPSVSKGILAHRGTG